MIISFTLENWMSFRDPVTFSMVATKERRHGGRIPKLHKYGTRVLPIAAIYGGNASGKSNFFQALNFARSLVVKVSQIDELIPVEPFCLDADGTERPSRFAFELLIDEIIYELSFAVTRAAVVEEKLVKIADDNEEVLYSRPGNPADPSLQPIFEGTRENQLFLTNSVSQRVSAFRPVYDWFKNKLLLVGSNSRIDLFPAIRENPVCTIMNELLQQLDTGIAHLEGEEIPFETILLPEFIKLDIQKNLKEGAAVAIQVPSDPNGGVTKIFITRKEGKLIAKKLMTSHLKTDGTKVMFETKQESDGSQRLIDLLPVFLSFSSQNSHQVCVIDEIDRSLHTLLTRRLLERYLASCSAKSRSQLLLTTHDVLLMDKQLLRHDEMWVAERDASGASTLYSFSEYKDAAKDKDIRKSYLQGRLGGIPRLLLNGPLRQCKSEEAE
ncbi:AAA family ATPase [Candidatus Electronema sp. JM]|uniref:AAA family ATPase n=1 Tax=Candidatus Electronema sp. JM TaxID=3401571 RepID=UPI003AA8541E